MKILFASISSVTFDVAMPEREPLGGSESCVCYLARQLARNGHDVTLLAPLPPGTPAQIHGVRHASIEMTNTAFFAAADFDAIITINNPRFAPIVREASPKAFNIAWLHMLPDQPAMAAPPQAHAAIDCAVFVSETQRAAFHLPVTAQTIGNAIAPAFENMFGSAEELRGAKQNRAVYSSTPFRGLDILIETMARTKAQTELDIYSSMRVYQVDDQQFAPLYERAKRNPRVRHHGSVSQTMLAEQFKSAAFFTYPSTFVETYCIAAQEAMAAGLKVISTDLGAIKETTMGYADLLPVKVPGVTSKELIRGFGPLLEKNEADFLGAPEAWAERMFDQVKTVNRLSTWQVRAAQWEAFLAPAVAWKRGQVSPA